MDRGLTNIKSIIVTKNVLSFFNTLVITDIINDILKALYRRYVDYEVNVR